MRIGLLGYGTVGQGVFELVQQRGDMRIVKVLSRRPLQLTDAQVVYDYMDILSDDTVDTVVELMGGLHPAREFIAAALESGKNVVTANKAVMSKYYAELTELAREKGVCLRCTAAVGGGISWLSELERASRVESIRSVGGILNGTCNFILDAMTRLGLSYRQALSQAQSLGYAEADPTMDVEGLDTWHKIALSANIAFQTCLPMDRICVAGISNITARDVEEFTKHAMVCKLLATATVVDARVAAFVQPTLVSLEEPEAAVPSNYNLITYVGNTSGRHSFFGQGAGRYPTAYNVVQDLVDVGHGKGFYCTIQGSREISNHPAMCYYVRGEQDSWLRENMQDTWGEGVVTKPVPVERMHRYLQQHPDSFIAGFGERKVNQC